MASLSTVSDGGCGQSVAPNVARSCGRHHIGENSGAPTPLSLWRPLVTESSTTPPALGDLLANSPTNWGKWGPDDEVGALNYLGPEQVLAAVKLVSAGKVFTLQRLIGDPKGDPVWPGRKIGRASCRERV